VPFFEEKAVKYALATLVLALAGCAATGDNQVAQAECKVAPLTTASVAGKARPVDALSQRQAEADLRTSEYGRRQLAANNFGTTAEALRDCDRSR
jgi:hypothetical protein